MATWSTTTQGTVSVAAGGGFDVSGSHVYSSATTPRSVVVAITDVGGQSASVTSSAVFADLVATASAAAISPTEGASFSGAVAAFTGSDPGGTSADFTAQIVWGDGATTSGTLSGSNGSYTVSGAHTYAEEGTGVPLSIVVTDLLGDHTTVANASNVADAALTAGSATSIAATEGATLTGAVGGFTDANTGASAGDFTAGINWGDGATSSGTVSAVVGTPGAFTVSGSHLYNEEGAESITVLIHDTGGAIATVNATATVGEAATIGTGATLAGTAGAAVSGAVVTFTHGVGGEPSSNFTASIDWGDGQTSAGTVSELQGTYSVAGSHTYAASGTFTVKASIADDGATTVINGAADVHPAGTPHQLFVIAVYHDVLGRLPDAGGLAFWTQLLDSGTAVSAVAQAIAHSDEYYQNFVIRPAYLNLLGRAADAGGVTFWTTQMDAGVTDQQLEADLVSAGGTTGEFYTKAGGTNTLWIDAVYKLLLGRAPDTSGEMFWNSQLAAGQTLNQVAQGIAGSTENNAQLINEDYFHYLGRAADSGGLAFWLSQFAAGQTNEDVIAGFTGSTEYYNKHTS